MIVGGLILRGSRPGVRPDRNDNQSERRAVARDESRTLRVSIWTQILAVYSEVRIRQVCTVKHHVWREDLSLTVSVKILVREHVDDTRPLRWRKNAFRDCVG